MAPPASDRSLSRKFQDILKLRNNESCFQRLRKEFMEIAHKHLDPTKTASDQLKSLKLVAIELKDTYPDFFSDDDSQPLECVIRYLRNRHNQSRRDVARRDFTRLAKTLGRRGGPQTSLSGSTLMRRTTPGNKTKRNSARLYPHTHHVPKLTNMPVSKVALVKRMAQNRAYFLSHPQKTKMFATPTTNPSLPHERQLPSQKGDQSIVSNTSPPREDFQYIASSSWRTDWFAASPSCSSTPQDSSLGSSSTAHPIPVQSLPASSPTYRWSQYNPSPLPTLSKKMVSNEQLPSTQLIGNRIAAIHRFLDYCFPPMTHYLQRFVDFECTPGEFLFSISKWNDKQIDAFLSKLPPGPNGEPMTPMEKRVLHHQLTEYFSS